VFTDLADKVVIVTGGASGIGEACVRGLVDNGARVLIADVNRSLGEALAEELLEEGAEVDYLNTDITDEEQVAALMARADELYGRIDCAVNNAGIAGAPTPLEATNLDDWYRVIDVNLTGTFLCLKHELALMKAQNSGVIVNVSSGAGVSPAAFLCAYTASKHGVLGLTKSAVAETVKTPIRINTVLPGSTRTPMIEETMSLGREVEEMIMKSIPCGRMGIPDEIANAIIWLCSDQSSYVNGASLSVDGGTTNR
jgi:NAD(P)-dependent dehydrogenase (short-subunit alcohol dehydrogenase family)